MFAPTVRGPATQQAHEARHVPNGRQQRSGPARSYAATRSAVRGPSKTGQLQMPYRAGALSLPYVGELIGARDGSSGASPS